MSSKVRGVLFSALFGALLVSSAPAIAQTAVSKVHALSLIGAPKYGAGFRRLDFVDPNAPKGGELRMSAIGGFDTLNGLIIKGDPATGMGLVMETLMTSPLDDISAEYGLIAESVEVPDDLSWVIFNLRPEARWHDGTPITADDVAFSFETLKSKGRPFFRFYYANVVAPEVLGPRRIKFAFSGPPNRELPQIVGQLPILSQAYWRERDFEATTLEPFLASGPYRVKDFETNRWIRFERVRDYWGRDLPINRGRYNFDTLRYDYYRDTTVAIEAFKAQEYDYRNENASKAWATAYDFDARHDGRVKLEEVNHERPTGMQAFIYNLRRPMFQNRALRQALAYAFDFEWSNKNLFYGQYNRTASYFSNSVLASRDRPSPHELEFLGPLRDQLPAEVFEQTYRPPSTAKPSSIRKNLRTAAKLLKDAGFVVRNNQLIDPATGKPVEFEILLVSPTFERVVLPFTKTLKRLGVGARVRTVDPAQYINRVRNFDFDIVINSFGQSESPGNEQRDFWGSAAADRNGSRNLIGIKDPAIDKLIDGVIFAPDRETLIAATRALDRALLWGHYIIPQWHVRYDRIAYWDKFGRPAKLPSYGVDLFAWWIDPAKQQALAGGGSE